MASYEWLKATLFQAKEVGDRTEGENHFIETNLTREKDRNRTPEQAKRDFINSCQWSWNTEKCLNLMKEGLVPYDIVDSIIQKTWGITNKFFSIFNSKSSLQNLIGARNIAILKIGNKCLAIDPNDNDKIKDNTKIETLLKQNKKNITENENKYISKKNFYIISHGSSGYADDFNSINENQGIVLYLSNIPTYGALATNGGINKRIDKYSPIVKKCITDINKVFKGYDIKNNVISNSYSNLLGAKIGKIVVDDVKAKLEVLSLDNIARDFYMYQSTQDIANVINSIENKRNIKCISIETQDDRYHPKNNASDLKSKIKRSDINGYNEKQFDNTYWFADGTTYKGDLQNGKIEGKGVRCYHNTKYDGDWKNNKREGKGVYYFKNGEIYNGDWKNDEIEGKGTYYYGNGKAYEGEWKNSERVEGKGKYYYYGRYVGEWKNGEKEGKGVYYFENGERYEGEWKYDKKEGKGIKYYHNRRKIYDGYWKNDKMQGKGIYYFENGDRYDGYWKNDKREGKGIYYYNNGDRYEGEWKNGEKEGKGIYYYNNGDRYEGEWKNDKKEGKGIKYYSNGDKYDGYWKNDKKEEKGEEGKQIVRVKNESQPNFEKTNRKEINNNGVKLSNTNSLNKNKDNTKPIDKNKNNILSVKGNNNKKLNFEKTNRKEINNSKGKVIDTDSINKNKQNILSSNN